MRYAFKLAIFVNIIAVILNGIVLVFGESGLMQVFFVTANSICIYLLIKHYEKH